MNRKYTITLNNEYIGTTYLEKADPPMGVVLGIIKILEASSVYKRVLDHCTKQGIVLNYHDPILEGIVTTSINDLKVFNEDAMEIKGAGTAIGGCKDEGYYTEIVGIPYPFYAEEFPHHRTAYEEQFSYVAQYCTSLS